VRSTVSRHRSKRQVQQRPPGDETRQLDHLLAVGAREQLKRWALLPTSDESGKMLARHHAELGARFLLTVAPWDVYRLAYDKRLTYQLASAVRIDHPVTFHPSTRTDVMALPCIFPVVLKPAFKECDNAFTSGRAWRVHCREELLERCSEACRLVPPETIMGGEQPVPGPSGESAAAARHVQVDASHGSRPGACRSGLRRYLPIVARQSRDRLVRRHLL